MDFPARPRLAEHVLGRRHLAGGEDLVVLHDLRTGRLVQIGVREWGLLAAADGTRDLDGIVLAARREGALARAPALRAFLEQLHGAGMLADGLPEEPAAPAGDDMPPASAPADRPGDRPLARLADFSLHCDGQGSCCRLYASVIFGPVEAARARSLLPEVRDGGSRHERIFMPERGSGPTGGSAVTLVDSRCAYLAGDGRCGLHAVAGAASKPLGCNLFPASLIDDGEEVRVSVSVECACVLASVGRPGGAPILAPEALTRGDLDEAVHVASLPMQSPISSGKSADRAAVRTFSRTLAALPPPLDVARALWSLAAAVDVAGLDADVRAAFESPAPIDPEAILPWLAALHARAARRVCEDAVWRGERDLARQASEAILATVSALLDPSAIADLSARPAPNPAGEAFYLRAAVHGHKLFGELPLALALRDRAVRLLVARAMPGTAAALDLDDPAFAEPLALVEAMLRGHGLEAYAYDLSGAS